MESGLLTVANPNRHGQGAQKKDLPECIAGFALNL